MLISFDLEKSQSSGKHMFISRLTKQLAGLGYEVVSKDIPSDIHLFTRKFNPKAKHNVYRVDGVCVNSEIYKYNNKSREAADYHQATLRSARASSGIIFQNEFCKKAFQAIIKEPPRMSACIMNGVHPKEFITDPIIRDKPYFLALCKWRPHKRLKDIISGFISAEIPGVELVVLGEPDVNIKHSKIIYKGWKDNYEVRKYVKGCISTVHLAWIDWCPNSVAESLAAKKQVIHTTSGGTPLLVKGRGYAVQDAEWDFKLHDLYDCPKLDENHIAEAYRKAYENPITFTDVEDIDIRNIAQQYAAFFEEVARTDNTPEKEFQASLG